MFQFKINHQIFFNRDKLFRAKIIENDECQLCGVRQTLEHLFAKCQHVHSFLLVSWWNSCNLPKVANNAKIICISPREVIFPSSLLLLYIYTAAKESESYSMTTFKVLLPPQGFGLWAKTRGGISLPRAYILKKVWNIGVVYGSILIWWNKVRKVVPGNQVS